MKVAGAVSGLVHMPNSATVADLKAEICRIGGRCLLGHVMSRHAVHVTGKAVLHAGLEGVKLIVSGRHMSVRGKPGMEELSGQRSSVFPVAGPSMVDTMQLHDSCMDAAAIRT